MRKPDPILLNDTDPDSTKTLFRDQIYIKTHQKTPGSDSAIPVEDTVWPNTGVRPKPVPDPDTSKLSDPDPQPSLVRTGFGPAQSILLMKYTLGGGTLKGFCH